MIRTCDLARSSQAQRCAVWPTWFNRASRGVRAAVSPRSNAEAPRAGTAVPDSRVPEARRGAARPRDPRPSCAAHAQCARVRPRSLCVRVASPTDRGQEGRHPFCREALTTISGLVQTLRAGHRCAPGTAGVRTPLHELPAMVETAREMATRPTATSTPEHKRLEQAREGTAPWKAWGPYLSERQWGTVREDYSDDGDAWNYFTHDHARSRAYRWGEDGIAGVCDERQRLCLALALWNGADPILKERMFGLSNGEGNHGEDVKEYWFYLDSTPTHSYLKCQYKYPQRAFPYLDLLATNARRGKQDMEYELLDTGVFDDDRYFDVVVEYAKGAPDDILMLVTAYNRGPDAATLHLLPTLWFRNTWSWGDDVPKPTLAAIDDSAVACRPSRARRVAAIGRPLCCAPVLRERDEQPAPVRDAECLAVREGRDQRLRRRRRRRTPSIPSGPAPRSPRTTCSRSGGRERRDPRPADRRLDGQLGGSADGGAAERQPPLGSDFDRVMKARRAEADKFYAHGHPRRRSTTTRAMVMRQALAGMLWGKQYYEYDVHRWLREHGVDPWRPSAPASPVRNVQWFHMIAGDIISMPDKWEYPWFAAWDLAFHCAPLSLVDVDFAKEQIELLLKTRYQHPNGQIPAYEWNFSDVNPPVTPWAALYVYEREAAIRGAGRPRVPRPRVRPADHELHVVGQPQGPRRPQPVPGRLPRPGQHRRVRSLGAAPGRRHARAGRRDRVDGPLLPVDARDRGRAGQVRARLRRHGAQVHRPLHVHRGRLESAPRRRRAVGRGGWLLLRRDADARRHPDPAEGALARGAAAAVRGHRVRARDARPLPRADRAARPISSSASRIRCRS